MKLHVGRVSWRQLAGAIALGAIVAALAVIIVRGTDIREARREANRVALARTHEQIVAVARLAREDRRRVQQIAELTHANARLVLRVCEVQNTGARSVNAIIGYFESISKQVRPGAATDSFWSAVPRPVVKRCTPAPTKGSP